MLCQGHLTTYEQAQREHKVLKFAIRNHKRNGGTMRHFGGSYTIFGERYYPARKCSWRCGFTYIPSNKKKTIKALDVSYRFAEIPMMEDGNWTINLREVMGKNGMD